MTTGRPGRGLGRGLASLIPDAGIQPIELRTEEPATGEIMVPLDEIQPNPEQPRQVFDPASLDELASSLRNHGVLSPLIVRKSVRGYVLIAGERRLRAAALAGLTEVP